MQVSKQAENWYVNYNFCYRVTLVRLVLPDIEKDIIISAMHLHASLSAWRTRFVWISRSRSRWGQARAAGPGGRYGPRGRFLSQDWFCGLHHCFAPVFK